MDSQNTQILDQVVKKISAANNVLVALSVNPTVDEMASAIGLTLLLDLMGKHATAIYSGETPNALEFLKPKDTFEANVNSLQDFIIALDKEKADHLRYKVDGDFVKVFITPYKTALTEEDLVFSHGEFNVDLVIALNVKTTNDFDNVLREHGRIMHDAGAINITTGEPGKLGELEWSDPSASSIAEMVTNYAMQLKDISLITKPIATALLTGIVAATGRFSNEKTTPKTMALASRLMAAGADQQLIAANIVSEVVPAKENKDGVSVRKSEDGAEGSIDINGVQGGQEVLAEAVAETPVEEVPVEETLVEGTPVEEQTKNEPEATAEVTEEISPEKMAEAEVLAGLAGTTEAVSVGAPEVANIEAPEVVEPEVEPAAEVPAVAEMPKVAEPEVEPVAENVEEKPAETEAAPAVAEMPKVEMPEIEPTGEIFEPKFDSSILAEAQKPEEEVAPEEPVNPGMKDYGKMVADALSEAGADNSNRGYVGNPLGENPAASMAPDVKSTAANDVPELSFDKAPEPEGEKSASLQDDSYIVNKPPKVIAPTGDMGPKVDLSALDDGDILPPPPAPPIDFNQVMPEVQVEEKAPVAPTEAQEAPNKPAEPGAFKIPGM